jgi:hypothetical protein
VLALGKEDQEEPKPGRGRGSKGVQEGQNPVPGVATRCDGDATATESKARVAVMDGAKTINR